MIPSTPALPDSPPATLQAQVESARAVLARLLQEVVVAESRSGTGEAARSLAADEQIVATALRERIEADRAAKTLARTSRSAERDPLTQLPNRVLLLDRCAQAIAAARRDGGRFALLVLDIEGFARVNASLGRPVGDDVLKLVAHRLVSAVGDADTVSRQDGDDFVVLATGLREPSDAARLASILVTALGAPSRRGDTVLRLTASIGISLFPDDGGDGERLVEAALAALQRAKRHGRGSFAFHGGAAAFQGMLSLPPVAAARRPIVRREAVAGELERRHALLRAANEKLVIAALDARLLQEAAERAQRRQAAFMDLVATELGNPLAPIRQAAAMLGGPRVEEPLMPLAKAIIEEQVERMARLLGAVREVSRADAFAVDFNRRRVDLTRVVNAAIEAWRPAMDTRLQVFTVALPAGGACVVGDASRLQQVVCNLLDNASKYTPDFGQVCLSLENAGGDVVLEVSDSGIGITPLAQASLFEPFAQDTHAIGFNGVGVGIGLAVVRALVEAHGGTVSATSEGRGLGSRFTVRLPRAEVPPK
ncbi:MAG: diguanylate cyclase [Betaproteobacteria bacterium]|nr:diguanylate cyclase [Betaproteobacteria bacterium]